MRNFIPSRDLDDLPQDDGNGKSEDEHTKTMFGVGAFLISESLIFASFIVAYVSLRLFSSGSLLPPGVKGPSLSTAVIIHSIVLLSSSLPAQLAENAVKRKKLNQFRLLWIITSLMGAYFLVGEVQEWLGLDFDVTTGQFGGAFYMLTGFHGLHVTAGILLQILMLVRSFIPGNYNRGYTGVSAVTLFWHVVDGIWVVLFSIFYLWKI